MNNLNNTINHQHEKIKSRPIEIQNYRDRLAKTLNRKRKINNEKFDEAEYELKRNKGKFNYIIGKFGFTVKAVEELVNLGKEREILLNIDKFKGLDYDSLVYGYFDNNAGSRFKWLVGKSMKLDKILIKELMRIGKIDIILAHSDKSKILNKKLFDMVLSYLHDNDQIPDNIKSIAGRSRDFDKILISYLIDSKDLGDALLYLDRSDIDNKDFFLKNINKQKIVDKNQIKVERIQEIKDLVNAENTGAKVISKITERTNEEITFNFIEAYLKEQFSVDSKIIDKVISSIIDSSDTECVAVYNRSFQISTSKEVNQTYDKTPPSHINPHIGRIDNIKGLDFYDNRSSNFKFSSTSTMDYYDFEDLFNE